MVLTTVTGTLKLSTTNTSAEDDNNKSLGDPVYILIAIFMLVLQLQKYISNILGCFLLAAFTTLPLCLHEIVLSLLYDNMTSLRYSKYTTYELLFFVDARRR